MFCWQPANAGEKSGGKKLTKMFQSKSRLADFLTFTSHGHSYAGALISKLRQWLANEVIINWRGKLWLNATTTSPIRSKRTRLHATTWNKITLTTRSSGSYLIEDRTHRTEHVWYTNQMMPLVLRTKKSRWLCRKKNVNFVCWSGFHRLK